MLRGHWTKPIATCCPGLEILACCLITGCKAFPRPTAKGHCSHCQANDEIRKAIVAPGPNMQASIDPATKYRVICTVICKLVLAKMDEILQQ